MYDFRTVLVNFWTKPENSDPGVGVIGNIHIPEKETHHLFGAVSPLLRNAYLVP